MRQASPTGAWVVGRRGFLLAGAAGLAAGGLGARPARAATETDLAFANFGLANAYLLADFYARSLETGRLGTGARPALRAGRRASNLHARALTELLAGAGEAPATPEDFAFEWPETTFQTAVAIRRTGIAVLQAALGASQRAAATVTEPTYRVLHASVAASLAQQLGALGGNAEAFPVALELEAASAALEPYLG